MIRRRTANSLWTVITIVSATILSASGQDQQATDARTRDYVATVRPLLSTYCFECHSEDVTEAEIDLAAFATVADVRRQPKVWQRVDEMLSSAQMPPKDSLQPNEDQRRILREWVRDHLTREAKANAGDPGPVVLRRLSNAEFTYTLRDLTGATSLDPAREFPIDGAAGEGFTNVGSALVMSPALLQKFLAAAKDVSSHAVLLPDGIRFSDRNTRRDWTDEWIADIQQFYARYSSSEGATPVNLQGIQFDTNAGGRLAVEPYIRVTLVERTAIREGQRTIYEVAHASGLSPKYLQAVWDTVTSATDDSDSLLLNELRDRWNAATPDDSVALSNWIKSWQSALWKFNAIGQIGREGGPPRWMEAISPVGVSREFRIPIPAPDDNGNVVLYLAAGDAGDGNDGDFVIWKNPRLEGPDGPPISLHIAAGIEQRAAELRNRALARTDRYLATVATATSSSDPLELATANDLDPDTLIAWLHYLRVGTPVPVEVTGHFTKKMLRSQNYDFIQGWGTGATPSIVANSSDQEVRIPGIAKPHSIVAHPSPTLFVAAGWQSPLAGTITVEANLTDHHPECGNGQEWFLQHRTSGTAGNIWQGDFPTGGTSALPAKTLSVSRGDVIAFVLGPRDGNHSCDLTEMNLVIREVAGEQRVWDLAKDVSDNILESNPHADHYGNAGIWHFYQGEMAGLNRNADPFMAVPPNSLLAHWQAAETEDARVEVAVRIRELALAEAPDDTASPDAVLHQHLRELADSCSRDTLISGLTSDPRFGRHPLGHEIDASDLAVRAPSVTEIRIPAAVCTGREIVVSGQVDATHGAEGSVQLAAAASPISVSDMSADLPITTAPDSAARQRVESAFDEFRAMFPLALCYTRIVPVDEVVTLHLHYREDDHLRRLMLDDTETAELERLWNELKFVSREPLQLVTSLEQLTEFATQDRPDLVGPFRALKKPIGERADAFRSRLVQAEPAQLQAVVEFASRAWRRRLTDAEQQELREFYANLRAIEIDHEEAIRTTLARVLTSPSFLYRREEPAGDSRQAPVSAEELASRLSYFLWSSVPDDELRHATESGELTDDAELIAQTHRMLDDDRTRRLAIHFACQWLHVRDFDQNDDKNEALYPEFATLRGDMYEETVRFFEDMFRNDGSILDVFDADHTFVNPALAKHYGIPFDQQDTGWRRVNGVREQGRGGVLAMATVLASQSGASRTSPILRGNWVFETLLGERLPRPPANVPQLPEAVPTGLTARQLIEQHSSVAECAKCHVKIDPYGFALEQYDAIGRQRPDPVDTKTELPDGTSLDGIDGLRHYLVNRRRDDVVRHFCRKLLGYALGREVQLSDEPLLSDMDNLLKNNDYRIRVAVEAIVTSRQFREIRGVDAEL